jgi:hypothetical protein
MTEVGGNIKELENIVQAKTNNVRVIEQGTSPIYGHPTMSHISWLIHCHPTSIETKDGIQPSIDSHRHNKRGRLLFDSVYLWRSIAQNASKSYQDACHVQITPFPPENYMRNPFKTQHLTGLGNSLSRDYSLFENPPPLMLRLTSAHQKAPSVFVPT